MPKSYQLKYNTPRNADLGTCTLQLICLLHVYQTCNSPSKIKKKTPVVVN